MLCDFDFFAIFSLDLLKKKQKLDHRMTSILIVLPQITTGGLAGPAR